MRAARLSPIAIVAMTALLASACGSSAKPAAAPAPPPRLRLAPAGTASADAAKPAMYPQGSTTYVLDGRLADLGARAAVRTLVNHDVTEADVTHLASVLGMHGTPTQTGTTYEVRDGDALLTVETAGGTTYVSYSSMGNAGAGSSPGSVGGGAATNPSAGTPDAPPTAPADTPVDVYPTPPVDPAPPVVGPGPDVTIEKPPTPLTPPVKLPPAPVPTIPPAVDVPNADDAAGIAKQLLTDLGVLGDQQWSHAVADAEGISVSCAPDGPCDPPPPSAITARTVTYSLQVDGHDVPDVSWSVTIGSHRKVEWLSGTWARPDNGNDYALRSTQNVFDDLRDGHAKYVGAQPMLARDAEEIAPKAAVDAPATPGAPETPGTLAPIVVHVTGVELGAARWDGISNGAPVTYLVPTYRFHANIAGGSPYDIELLALDPASFSVDSPPVTAVAPTLNGSR